MGSLFRGHCSEFFEGVRRKVIQEIDQIPNADIERAEPNDLANQFCERYSVVSPQLGDDLSYDEPAFTAQSDRAYLSRSDPGTARHDTDRRLRAQRAADPADFRRSLSPHLVRRPHMPDPGGVLCEHTGGVYVW